MSRLDNVIRPVYVQVLCIILSHTIKSLLVSRLHVSNIRRILDGWGEQVAGGENDTTLGPLSIKKYDQVMNQLHR